MDTFNKQGVGVIGNEVAILRPRARMSATDAMMFAAWLAAMAKCADPSCPDFGDCVEAVEST